MEADDAGGIKVSEFDDSIEKHLSYVASVSTLCQLPQIHQIDDASEIKRVASSITFLRHWRDFAYEPRTVKFSSEVERSESGNGAATAVNLPQFSSAAVLKGTQSTLKTSASSKSGNDFVLYCGGPIWGLDWCPQVRQDSGGNVTCEFVAVAAHPPGSSYNKLGTPLIGRGVIQIWCLVNANANENMEELSIVKFHEKSGRGRPKKKQEMHGGLSDTLLKRPVVKPREEPTEKSGDHKIPKKRGRPRKEQKIEFMTDEGDHIALINYLPAKDAAVGEKSTLANRATRSVKHIVSKSKKKIENQNNNNRSQNSFCATDSLNGLFEDNSNQALVPYLMERYAQPVALGGTVLGKSTATNSGEMIPTTLHRTDLLVVKDCELNCTNNFTSLRSVSTQPIKTYVRRHKLAKKTICEETVLICPINSEQGTIRVDDCTDDVMSDDLESDISGTQTRQQMYAREELPAISSATNDEKECHLVSSMVEFSKDDAANVDPCTQDATYPTADTHDLGPTLLCYTPSGEEGESLSTDIIIPQDLVLPRLSMCLAHNGKVAWDAKWRPVAHVSHCKLRMGYLAVLLGNGSLEVWDVPLPNVVCDIFSPSHVEGTDPRFMKLKPVFKCSKLMFKGKQSIPLTVEWSTSFPNDLLLAGCHDGTVAVWKFSEGNPCEDTRPLLCFRADTNAIRAVSWAPAGNDGEDANVFVTAGHTSLKFWDMRDPFRPLWSHTLLRIYSVDWMPKPRCVVISSDDGSLKLISISEVSNDLPVTGKTYSGTKLQGLHAFNCTPYAIWSVHISRVTGMAAYCSSDGTVVRFQLTTKAVEKDHTRYRVPHFLFGSFSGDDSVLTVNTPPLNTPTQLKKVVAGPQSMRALLELCKQSQTNHIQPKESSVENQTLVVWHGNDSVKDQCIPTASTGIFVDGNSQLATECQVVGANNRTALEKPIKTVMKSSDPPHKILAIHRVRWNMNKGCERWLCSGGAAGIVRCQEMVFTDVDKKYFRDK